MTLRHMKIFAEVCKELSITRAADNLNMTQPTVSIAIKEMESHYHTLLFERMNRRIYLTEKGQQLFQYAQTIIAQFSEADNCISGLNADYTLRIGCNISYGATKLTDIMERFKNDYPEIKYNLSIANSDHIEKMLLNNQLDFAIVDNLNTSDFFVSKLVEQENLLAFCGLNYSEKLKSPMTLAELSEQPLLLRETGSGSRNAIDQIFELHGLKTYCCMESTSSIAILQAAIHNLGICILPESFISSNMSDGLFQIQLDKNYFIRRYFLIHHKNKLITEKMKKFFEYYLDI